MNRVYDGPGGLAAFGEGLVQVVEIAGSNSASDIDVCPISQDEALRLIRVLQCMCWKIGVVP